MLTRPGTFQLVPAVANGQPAFALYRQAEDGARHAYAIQVLTLRRSLIAGIVTFLDVSLFPSFRLPLRLDASPASAGRAG